MQRLLRPLTILATLALAGTAYAAQTSPSESFVSPAVAATFDGRGNLWRVGAGEQSLRVDVSQDFGRDFERRGRISTVGATPRISPEDPPQVVVQAGAITVAWTGLVDGKPRAFVSRSTDDGSTFSAPRAIEGTGPAPQIRTTLATGRGGTWLVFLDPMGSPPPADPVRSAGGSNAGAHHEHGGHGGALYGLELPAAGSALANWTATRLAPSTCQCCRLDAEVTDDGLLVLSRMIFGGGVRDFGLVRTTAAGSTVLRVTDDDWHIDACPEHGGGLSLDGRGRTHMTWFTQGRNRQGSFYAVSADEGRTWSAPLSLGDADALAGHADVLAIGDQVTVAWQQYDGRRTSIHARVSGDGGRQFGPTVQLAATAGRADYPRLVSDGRQAWVSWYAAQEGYQLLSPAGK